MASGLRKYKFNGPATAKPGASSAQSAKAANDPDSPPGPSTASTEHVGLDMSDLKLQILDSIRGDIATVIREELKNALAEDFERIKADLQAVRNDIANNMAATRREIDQVKTTVNDVETGLSEWSDTVAGLQTTVTGLQKELADLRGKCEDMEGRMRRCNVRILGIPEEPNSSSTASVSKLLKEILGMDKDVLIDRSHRSLGPKRQDGKPRAIVAKLHYYQDCVEILRRARTQAPLRLHGQPVAIFPDYTTAVAKARAAFTEVRRALRDKQGVRFGILFPARLRISYEGEDKEFVDPGEAMDYVKRRIIRTAGNGT